MKHALYILLAVLLFLPHLRQTLPYADELFFLVFLGINILMVCRSPFVMCTHRGTWTVAFVWLLMVICFIIHGNPYGTSTLYHVLACWAMYIVFHHSFLEKKGAPKVIAALLISTCVYELVWGIGQLLGLFTPTSEYFKLGGSFGNPTAYAGYLAVLAPLILSLWLCYRRIKKAENLQYVLLGCLIFITYMLVMSNARGAWLACGLGVWVVFAEYYSLYFKAKQWLSSMTYGYVVTGCLSVLLLIGSAYLLYQWKADSAFGRLLVWKISMNHFWDGGFWGQGFDAFAANYGKWQSAYFASGAGTEAERQVADYVTLSYNDILNTFMEQGWLAGCTFAALIGSSCTEKHRSLSALFVGGKAMLFALIPLLLISYPLQFPAYCLLLVFSIAMVWHDAHTTVNWLYLRSGRWLMPILALFIATLGMYKSYGNTLTTEGEKLFLRGNISQGLEYFKKAAPMMHSNGAYNFYYGSALWQTKQYVEAATHLEKATQLSSLPNAFLMLGNCYKDLKEYNKAKDAYLIAVNMTPNKLYPQYLLAKMLIEQQNDKEATQWAERIMSTPVKVPTTAAKEIKAEMEAFLANQKRKSNLLK